MKPSSSKLPTRNLTNQANNQVIEGQKQQPTQPAQQSRRGSGVFAFGYGGSKTVNNGNGNDKNKEGRGKNQIETPSPQGNPQETPSPQGNPQSNANSKEKERVTEEITRNYEAISDFSKIIPTFLETFEDEENLKNVPDKSSLETLMRNSNSSMSELKKGNLRREEKEEKINQVRCNFEIMLLSIGDKFKGEKPDTYNKIRREIDFLGISLANVNGLEQAFVQSSSDPVSGNPNLERSLKKLKDSIDDIDEEKNGKSGGKGKWGSLDSWKREISKREEGSYKKIAEGRQLELDELREDRDKLIKSFEDSLRKQMDKSKESFGNELAGARKKQAAKYAKKLSELEQKISDLESKNKFLTERNDDLNLSLGEWESNRQAKDKKRDSDITNFSNKISELLVSNSDLSERLANALERLKEYEREENELLKVDDNEESNEESYESSEEEVNTEVTASVLEKETIQSND